MEWLAGYWHMFWCQFFCDGFLHERCQQTDCEQFYSHFFVVNESIPFLLRCPLLSGKECRPGWLQSLLTYPPIIYLLVLCFGAAGANKHGDFDVRPLENAPLEGKHPMVVYHMKDSSTVAIACMVVVCLSHQNSSGNPRRSKGHCLLQWLIERCHKPTKMPLTNNKYGDASLRIMIWCSNQLH